MIPAGTEIVAQVVGQSSNWLPLNTTNVRTIVLDELGPYASSIRQLDIDAGTFFGVPDLWDWPYSAVITMTTLHSHGSVEDIRDVIQGAFWRATNSRPTVSFPSIGEHQGQGSGQQPPTAPSFGQIGILIVVALVAVTATAVFTAKRG